MIMSDISRLRSGNGITIIKEYSGRLLIVLEEELTPEEIVTWRRIGDEPERLLVDESDTFIERTRE